MALLAQQGVLQANTQRTNASNKARKKPRQAKPDGEYLCADESTN